MHHMIFMIPFFCYIGKINVLIHLTEDRDKLCLYEYIFYSSPS